MGELLVSGRVANFGLPFCKPNIEVAPPTLASPPSTIGCTQLLGLERDFVSPYLAGKKRDVSHPFEKYARQFGSVPQVGVKI